MAEAWWTLQSYWQSTDSFLSIHLRWLLLAGLVLIFGGVVLLWNSRQNTRKIKQQADYIAELTRNPLDELSRKILWMTAYVPQTFEAEEFEDRFRSDHDDTEEALEGLEKNGFMRREIDLADMSYTGKWETTREGRQFVKRMDQIEEMG